MTDTRYALLNPGDVIQEGDEYFVDGGWEIVSGSIGNTKANEWPFRRALPAADTTALGAVAMRDAAVSALNSVADEWSCGHDARTCNCPSYVEQWRFAADEVAALEPPTHAAQLAAALAVPEVAALVDALSVIEVLTATGDGLDPEETIRVHLIANRALAALEARHDHN